MTQNFASVTHFEEGGRKGQRQTDRERKGEGERQGGDEGGRESVLFCKVVILVFGYTQKLVLLLR